MLNKIRRLITPTRKFQWVIDNDCSWTGRSYNGKWIYYWYGDIKTGYPVKVDSEIVDMYEKGYTEGYWAGFRTGKAIGSNEKED